MANTTDEELLAAARRFLVAERGRLNVSPADGEKWREFESTYSDIIRDFCKRHRMRGVEIDDLLQNIWHSVLKQFPNFRRKQGKGVFRKWLRTIADRAAITMFRKESRRRKLHTPRSNFAMDQFPAADPSPSDKLDDELQRFVQSQVLTSMESDKSPRIRRFGEILRLYYLEGVSDRELAERFGTTVEAIRKRRSRAMQEIYRRCSSHLGPDAASRPGED